MAKNMNRDFKGVWIPKEVWLDTRLNALEKAILTEIDSLDQGEKGCYASNDYLAEFCQCSKRKVSEAISKLIKCGYIYLQNFDGRKRELKSRLSNFERQTSKKCEANSQNLLQSNIENNIDNNIDKKERKEGEGNKENEDQSQEMERVYTHYLNTFGTTAGRYKLTDKRKAKLQSRLQDCGADMLIDAIDHARADYFYNGDNDRGWKADLDFIIRSYENTEKLANLTPRQRKLSWQEKKEQEERAEVERKFGEPKYVYEPCNLPEGSYELLGGTSEPDEPTREPFSEDFIEQMRQRAFGGKNKKEVKNDN